MRRWKMFAHKREDESTFTHICPDARTVTLYGRGEVHAVTVKESSKPTHWGWLESNKTDGPPCMIWPTLTQLIMCFAYGMEVEIEEGSGRMIELQIEERRLP